MNINIFIRLAESTTLPNQEWVQACSIYIVNMVDVRVPGVQNYHLLTRSLYALVITANIYMYRELRQYLSYRICAVS